jgi:2,4-dienoyl-CoA reductase-like NADH-dependent reductase (Old Yellow Enzyme family)
MATVDGAVTDQLVELYTDLAKGGAGLIITGHIYVTSDGQCSPRQTGAYDDALLPGLKKLTQAVHRHGGLIFAELSHAGSQSVMPGFTPLAPSISQNAIFETEAREMSLADIERVVAAFGSAARRIRDAGFDGIHLHGGNGYLISQFASPITNRRADNWGGNPQDRGRFAVSVYHAVRETVGSEFPVTARMGIADAVPGGLEESEGLLLAKRLADLGVDAIEVSFGIMDSYLRNIRPYVAVSARRAVEDWLFPRLWRPSGPQAYYRPFARELKKICHTPVILVGGIRTADVMTDVIDSGDADFLSLARPFIRQPDLPARLAEGQQGVACVSCNMCLSEDGYEPLQCWRKKPSDMFRYLTRKVRQTFKTRNATDGKCDHRINASPRANCEPADAHRISPSASVGGIGFFRRRNPIWRPQFKWWVLTRGGRKCFIFQGGLTDTLSAADCSSLYPIVQSDGATTSSATKAVGASSAMLP